MTFILQLLTPSPLCRTCCTQAAGLLVPAPRPHPRPSPALWLPHPHPALRRPPPAARHPSHRRIPPRLCAAGRRRGVRRGAPRRELEHHQGLLSAAPGQLCPRVQPQLLVCVDRGRPEGAVLPGGGGAGHRAACHLAAPLGTQGAFERERKERGCFGGRKKASIALEYRYFLI